MFALGIADQHDTRQIGAAKTVGPASPTGVPDAGFERIQRMDAPAVVRAIAEAGWPSVVLLGQLTGGAVGPLRSCRSKRSASPSTRSPWS